MPEDGLLGINEKFERLFRKADRHEDKLDKQDERFLKIEGELNDVRKTVDWHDREIKSIVEDIKDIHGDTRWLRRTLTGSFIAAISTGLIGGFIGVLWTLIGK